MATIVITKFDYERLQQLLQTRKPLSPSDLALQKELSKATIVEPTEIPADVITMNSEVLFADEKGRDLHYWLVFPEDADITANKLSVLSPIGCALIGYKVGDTISLETPQGSRQLTVREITHQPEREGDFTS